MFGITDTLANKPYIKISLAKTDSDSNVIKCNEIWRVTVNVLISCLRSTSKIQYVKTKRHIVQCNIVNRTRSGHTFQKQNSTE